MEDQITINSTNVKNKTVRTLRGVRLVRETAAIVIWGWIVVDSMLFDLHSLVPQSVWPWNSPWLPWFEFLFAVTAFLIFLKIFGTKRFLKFCLFVLAYPLIWIGWRLPKAVFMNAEVALPFAPFVIDWWRHFKLRAASILIACIGATLVLADFGDPMRIGGVGCLVIYLVIHYVLQIKKTFLLARDLPKLGDTIVGTWDHAYSTMAHRDHDALQLLEPDSEAFTKKRLENIRGLLHKNAMQLWIAGKIQKAFDHHWLDVALISSVFCTFLVTVLVFTLCYSGISTLAPSSFSVTGSLWLHFFMSVNAIFHNSVDSIAPISQIAQVFFLAEEVCGFLLFSILVFLITTVMREGYRKGVELLVHRLTVDRREYEVQLSELYGLSVRDAIAQLESSPAFGERLNGFIKKYLGPTGNSGKLRE